MASITSRSIAEDSAQRLPTEILLNIAEQLIPTSGFVVSSSGSYCGSLKNLMMTCRILRRHIEERLFSRPLNIWIDNECKRDTKTFRFYTDPDNTEVLNARCVIETSFFLTLRSLPLSRWSKINIHLNPARQMQAVRGIYDEDHSDACVAAEVLDMQRKVFCAQSGAISRWMLREGVAIVMSQQNVSLIVHELEGRFSWINSHMPWWTHRSLGQVLAAWNWIGGDLRERVVLPYFSFLQWEHTYEGSVQSRGALQVANEVIRTCATQLKDDWETRFGRHEDEDDANWDGSPMKAFEAHQDSTDRAGKMMVIRVDPKAARFWAAVPMCSPMSVIPRSGKLPEKRAAAGIIELPTTS